MIAYWDIKNLSKPIGVIKDESKEFVYSVNFLCNQTYIVCSYKDGTLVVVDLYNTSNIFKKEINEFEKTESNLDDQNSVSQ